MAARRWDATIGNAAPPSRRLQQHNPRLAPAAAATRPQPSDSSSSGETPPPPGRRQALALLAAVPAASLLAGAAPAAAADAVADAPAQPAVDTTVTHRLYLDIGVCPEAVRTDRRLGDKTPFCAEPEPLGRVVVGLYGNAAPGTVAMLVAAAQAGAYDMTSITKVLPGRYLVLGTQGPKRSGLVQPPPGLPASNPDLLSAAAFRLPAGARPGTVSLNLSESEDDDYVRFDPKYKNLSLLVTTGPGPVPSLDGENIVVGSVLEGLGVIAAVTQVPTFSPNDNARAWNSFASAIGDDRAGKTAAKWGRPLQAVVIRQAGLL